MFELDTDFTIKVVCHWNMGKFWGKVDSLISGWAEDGSGPRSMIRYMHLSTIVHLQLRYMVVQGITRRQNVHAKMHALVYMLFILFVFYFDFFCCISFFW